MHEGKEILLFLVLIKNEVTEFATSCRGVAASNWRPQVYTNAEYNIIDNIYLQRN